MKKQSLLKRILCRIGWHRLPFYKDWSYIENDGASDHVRCNWCNYEGMIDSQGNLF